MGSAIRKFRWGLMFIIILCGTVFAFCAEEKISKTFQVNPGGKLVLETSLGCIEVKTESGNTLRVEILIHKDSWSDERMKRFLKDFDIEFSQNGNDVSVRAEYEKGYHHWFSGSKNPEVNFVIVVPKVYNLDLQTSGGWIKIADLEGNAVCETSGGSLDFGHIKGTVDGHTSGGAIQVAGCEGTLDVETSGGSISVGSTKGDIRANTSGGSISIDETYGSVQAETSGGSISAHFNQNPLKDCFLETSGGWITVSGPNDLHVDLDAETSGGHIYTAFPVTLSGEINPQSMLAKINGGGPRLHLRTSGGNIRVEKKR
jgi:DUF4097 and DUF4098 domain-containing protein YvlB